MNIAVAQSGGPTCAINASLVGVFRESLKEPTIDAIFGSINGVEGIIHDHLIDLKTMILTNEDMELLRQTPSTVLGSCRYKLPDWQEDDAVYQQIVHCLKRRQIGAFFYIGGNDSMDTVQKLSSYFREKKLDIKVIGIPKTIDNDLCITDHTPGFGSAAKYVATTMQEIVRDSSVYSMPSITIVEIMGSFIKVFAMILVLHWVIIVFQYTVAGSAAKKNPFALIKNMLPAYTTAIGTQSSAATIPVTTQCTKNNGVSDGMAEFVCPLCATIHLSGSTITLTSCAMAVMVMTNQSIGFGKMFPFILMLGVTMVAAPGVPGGAVMAALGILQSMLGFDETMCGLMIALYIAQDSFGTACNVTGDGAIAVFMDAITGKKKAAAK